jgi:hypothetical protein
MTYFVEVGATPFCGMLACVAIEDCEEALAADATKVDDERICVLHRSARALVLGDADLVRCILCSMAVEDLGGVRTCAGAADGWHTPCVSNSAVVIDFERALGDSVKVIGEEEGLEDGG